MENYTKSFILGLLMLSSCTKDPDSLPDINSNSTQMESILTNLWVYESVSVRGTDYRFANANMELISNRAPGQGGNRSDLVRRRIIYFDNGTYQLRWTERGDYNLGTYGESNWQPNFGYWVLDGNTLIHNPNMYYETSYEITITENSFSRTSQRQMIEALQGALWEAGEVVEQTEKFILVTGK